MNDTKFLPYVPDSDLSEQDRETLRPFLSDTGESVFVLRGLDGVVGAAFARYSRQKGGVRHSLLEFVRDGQIDPQRSKELMERVLIQYGDDSVGELEGAHAALEQISMLATKDIEDRRIGGSPIEQSSRYVVYDHRDIHGNYRYYRDAAIRDSGAGEAYVAAMDFLFDTYCSLQEPLRAYLQRVKPIEDAEYDVLGTGGRQRLADLQDERARRDFERTYAIDLKTKACDTLRGLLPVATLTNVGLFGNGRFYQNLLSHLYSGDLPEWQSIATRLHRALDTIIPVYVKRARRNDFVVARRAATAALAREVDAAIGPGSDATGESVRLLSRPADDTGFLTALCADLLFPYSRHSLQSLRDSLRTAGAELAQRILATAVGERSSRRDHLPRGFESGYPLTYEIVADYGMYRDLQRHRMLTQQRQMLTPELGYHLPAELEEAGLAERAREAFARSAEAYGALRSALGPEAAQYALCMGYNIRFTFGMNLREASHFIELRTAPQGHPNYRRVARLMLEALPEEYRFLCRFADTNEHFWARGDSEARQRVKERRLDGRF